MNLTKYSLTFILLSALFFVPSAQAAERKITFTLQDHINRAWADDMVHYDISVMPGEMWRSGVRLRDEKGKAVPVKLAEVSTHPDGSVKAAQAWFVVSLSANGKRTLVLHGGKKKDAPPEYSGGVAMQREKNSAVLSNSKIAVRVLNGEAKFSSAQPVSQLSAQAGRTETHSRAASRRQSHQGFPSRSNALDRVEYSAGHGRRWRNEIHWHGGRG